VERDGSFFAVPDERAVADPVMVDESAVVDALMAVLADSTSGQVSNVPDWATTTVKPY
jgi:hypothetical protein